jgi:hypothetical protein
MSAADMFAHGGRQDGDAELIAAEREMRHLLDEGRNLNEPDPELTQRWDRIGERMTLINNTAPTTFAGCAVKLRFLTDDEVGIGAGDRDDDVPSLRQVLTFVEAEAFRDEKLQALADIACAEMEKGASTKEAFLNAYRRAWQ